MIITLLGLSLLEMCVPIILDLVVGSLWEMPPISWRNISPMGSQNFLLAIHMSCLLSVQIQRMAVKVKPRYLKKVHILGRTPFLRIINRRIPISFDFL